MEQKRGSNAPCFLVHRQRSSAADGGGDYSGSDEQAVVIIKALAVGARPGERISAAAEERQELPPGLRRYVDIIP
jgi:hypothetical protein